MDGWGVDGWVGGDGWMGLVMIWFNVIGEAVAMLGFGWVGLWLCAFTARP